MTRLKSSFIEVEDLEEAYELVLEKGWGDGLPVVPPTAERVEKMLDAVDADPQTVVGRIPPAMNNATIEKIAINATMAGCRPEYLPVVIAAVEAALVPEVNLGAIQGTTCPAAPMLVVNGPIRKQLNINSGIGCLGPGWRANATIGRAFRLSMITLGGAVPGQVAKSMMSLPERYTFCFAEDEEESPWEPLHVEKGFDKGTSTVTVLPIDMLIQVGITGQSLRDGGQRLAEATSMVISKAAHNSLLFHAGEPAVVIPAITAKWLSEKIDKRGLKELIFERCRIPPEEAIDLFGHAAEERAGVSSYQLVDGKLQPCDSADEVMLVVAGGPMPAYAAILPSFYSCKSATVAIRF